MNKTLKVALMFVTALLVFAVTFSATAEKPKTNSVKQDQAWAERVIAQRNKAIKAVLPADYHWEITGQTKCSKGEITYSIRPCASCGNPDDETRQYEVTCTLKSPVSQCNLKWDGLGDLTDQEVCDAAGISKCRIKQSCPNQKELLKSIVYPG